MTGRIGPLNRTDVVPRGESLLTTTPEKGPVPRLSCTLTPVLTLCGARLLGWLRAKPELACPIARLSWVGLTSIAHPAKQLTASEFPKAGLTPGLRLGPGWPPLWNTGRREDATAQKRAEPVGGVFAISLSRK